MKFVPLSRLLAAERAETPPVAWTGATALTSTNFRGDVAHNARRLRQAGCARGGLACHDSYWFAVGLFALLHAGARVVIPANVQPGTLADVAADCDVMVGDAGMADGATLVLESGGAPAASVLDADAAIIEFFTSGTTGQAKRVVKTLALLEREAETLEALWGATLAGAPVVATVPHQHVFGLTFKILWPLAAGRPFCRITHAIWETLLAEMPAGAILVTSPAHLGRMTGIGALAPGTGPRMILSAGAPLAEGAADEARTLLGTPVTEIFGSTETGAIASRRRDRFDPPWIPLPGNVVGRTGDGCLRVRSPFVGGDGLHESADLVDLVPGGGFRFKGRNDRIVKIESKRISLAEVEAALTALPEVHAAALAVLPRDHPRLGAAVILTGLGRAGLADLGPFRFGRTLRRALADRLDVAALPRSWRFVEQLPAGALGKRRDGDVAALFAPLEPVTRAVRREPGRVEVDLFLPADLACFQGHFPGSPILPGVAQLDWAVKLADRHLATGIGAARSFQVKFRNVIPPQCAVTLCLHLDAPKARLHFEYRKDGAVASSGTIHLAP